MTYQVFEDDQKLKLFLENTKMFARKHFEAVENEKNDVLLDKNKDIEQ